MSAGGIWRFAESLPSVESAYQVSLGEGATPLLAAPRLAEAIGLRALYLKLESQNPTGSFKDRGTAVAVSLALASGARHLVEDSSGNAGASAAAYAARAGLACTIFAPATAPAAKLRQARAYGATVESVDGSRELVAAAARRAARGRGRFHLDHNRSEVFAAGAGTVALEIMESLPAASVLVMPVGGGSMLLGVFEALQHRLRAAGSGTVPSLFAVQPEACAPLVEALARGWDRPLPVQPGATIAGGITIADPPRGVALLAALRGSGGGGVAVDDGAIRRWQGLLARLEGVYAEPTSAAALAGLARLVAERTVAADRQTVVVITGHGLKDA